MAEPYALARVRLWGKTLGAISEDADGIVAFEYDPPFRESGLEISPVHLPLSRGGPATWPELRRVAAFDGLPGVFADALPDRFGNAVIAKYFADRGRPESSLSPVQKLLYIGKRAMGALEFEPAIRMAARKAEQESLALSLLVEQARMLIEGSVDEAIPEIMRVGASAGGARAKALILRDRARGRIRSGFAARTPAEEHWLVKFDGVGELGAPDHQARPFNRVEYAYSLLARAAGIDFPETELLRGADGLAHFAVRRFDRDGDRRLHFHSLGGLQHVDYNQPGAYSYEQLLRTILTLDAGYPALEEGFRRAVFNVAAVNQDDHVKNIGFLMDESGRWQLAPAYDLTFARGTGYTRRHQMSLNGKQDGFTRDDLLALGKRAGLRSSGRAVIDQVLAALSQWPDVAGAAGVPAREIQVIGAAFRELTATP